MSLVSVARLGCGRGSDRFRTRPAAVCEPCRQTSFIGPAILRGMRSATRANAARHWKPDEPARRRSAPSSSSPPRSCIGHRCSIDCASPGLVCGQWTVLPLACAVQRFCESMHTHRIRYSLSRLPLSMKSNRFVASPMKKMRAHRNAMHRCHRKPPRHRCRGGVFSVRRSLRRACRSARTTDLLGQCSSRSGESACCRCAVR